MIALLLLLMYHIKFSAYLIDWKDHTAIQTHLTNVFLRSKKKLERDKKRRWEKSNEKKTPLAQNPSIFFSIYLMLLENAELTICRRSFISVVNWFVNYLLLFFFILRETRREIVCNWWTRVRLRKRSLCKVNERDIVNEGQWENKLRGKEKKKLKERDKEKWSRGRDRNRQNDTVWVPRLSLQA